MTFAEFLRALAKTDRTWELHFDSDGRYRIRNRESHCPLSAVASTRGIARQCNVSQAADVLLMSQGEAQEIADAADDFDGAMIQIIRRQLLLATGLEESGG